MHTAKLPEITLHGATFSSVCWWVVLVVLLLLLLLVVVVVVVLFFFLTALLKLNGYKAIRKPSYHHELTTP